MKTRVRCLAIILAALSFPSLAGAELGLGPPVTHLTVQFVRGSEPQAGVTAVLVDGAIREQQAVSGDNGKVSFVFQAPSANAELTFWKEGVPASRKAIPYVAGNHYRLDLQLPEAK